MNEEVRHSLKLVHSKIIIMLGGGVVELPILVTIWISYEDALLLVRVQCMTLVSLYMHICSLLCRVLFHSTGVIPQLERMSQLMPNTPIPSYRHDASCPNHTPTHWYPTMDCVKLMGMMNVS